MCGNTSENQNPNAFASNSLLNPFSLLSGCIMLVIRQWGYLSPQVFGVLQAFFNGGCILTTILSMIFLRENKFEGVHTQISYVYNKTGNVFNETSDVFNKTNNVFNKTSDIVNKTSDVYNKTSNVFNKSSDVINKTSDVVNKTSDVYNKTNNVFKKSNKTNDLINKPSDIYNSNNKTTDIFHKTNKEYINKTSDQLNKTNNDYNKPRDVYNRTSDDYVKTNDDNNKTDHYSKTGDKYNTTTDVYNKTNNDYNVTIDHYNKASDSYNKTSDVYNKTSNELNNITNIDVFNNKSSEEYNKTSDIFNGTSFVTNTTYKTGNETGIGDIIDKFHEKFMKMTGLDFSNLQLLHMGIAVLMILGGFLIALCFPVLSKVPTSMMVTPIEMSVRIKCIYIIFLHILVGYVYFYLIQGIEASFGGYGLTFMEGAMGWTRLDGLALMMAFWSANASACFLAAILEKIFTVTTINIVGLILMGCAAVQLVYSGTHTVVILSGTCTLGIGLGLYNTCLIELVDYYSRLDSRYVSVWVGLLSAGELCVPTVIGWLFEEYPALMFHLLFAAVPLNAVCYAFLELTGCMSSPNTPRWQHIGFSDTLQLTDSDCCENLKRKNA
jgi:hypothetical protein